MSLASHSADRAKFGYLLQLAQEQIKALEMGDMDAFKRILAAKRTLINGLTNAHAMIQADPSLAGVATQIQECDQAALRLLYRKTGRIMRELSELQQAKKARRAYFKSAQAAPRRAYPFQADTPRFIDQRS